MSSIIQKLDSKTIEKLRSTSRIVLFEQILSEILMNSIDANSKSIEIHVNLKEDGCVLILKDDGEGILPSSFQFIGQRNASSKFDLEPKSSYGKRGEALANICALSTVHIVSRTNMSKAYQVIIKEGVQIVKRFYPFSHSKGTTVTITNLFPNVPVRRKSLASLNFQILKKTILPFVMWFHELKFKLFDLSSKKTVFDFESTTSLQHRYLQLKPETRIKITSILPIKMRLNGTRIEGIISSETSSTTYQQLYIHKRPLQDQIISECIRSFQQKHLSSIQKSQNKKKEAKKLSYCLNFEMDQSQFHLFDDYTHSLVEFKKPVEIKKIIHQFLCKVFGLHIKIDQVRERFEEESNLDLNVDNVSIAIKRSLSSLVKSDYQPLAKIEKRRLSSSLSNEGIDPTKIQDYQSFFASYQSSLSGIGNFLYSPILSQKNKSTHPQKDRNLTTNSLWAEDAFIKWQNPIQHVRHLDNPVCEMSMSQTSISISKKDLVSLKFLCQFDKKFLICILQKYVHNDNHNNCYKAESNVSMANILVILDQHAVDERIKLESILSKLRNKVSDLSKFPTHISFSNDSLDFFDNLRDVLTALDDYKSHFKYWGISYNIDENLGVCTVLELPEVLVQRCRSDPAQLKHTLVEHAYHIFSTYPRGISNIVVKRMPIGLMEMCQSLACRGAIMFGESLDKMECEKMISELSLCEFPFQCAHGRPSIYPLVQI